MASLNDATMRLLFTYLDKVGLKIFKEYNIYESTSCFFEEKVRHRSLYGELTLWMVWVF
jgi:hypothetical protein